LRYTWLSEEGRDGCYMTHSGKLEMYKIFGQKHHVKKSPKRHKRGCGGDIKSDVVVIMCAQVRDRWRALVNALMKVHIP
jgi:hypothetical protein